MLFDLVEQAKRLISIRSISEEGNRALVESLVPYCEQLGFNVTLQKGTDHPTADEVNLIAHSVPLGSPDLCPEGLALLTHLDTVPPGDLELWTETGGDPFRATVKGDKIYGLGSADTKLDILCKLLAMDRLVEAHGHAPLSKIFKIPVALIGTFGEERALAGARLIRESGILHPKFALIGEPSDMKAVLAHKGIFYLKASFTPPHFSREGSEELPLQAKSFKGRAAHGSMPHLGENAIEKAFGWMQGQQEIEIVTLHGGTVHNIVPEFCEVTYRSRRDERIPTYADFISKFEKVINDARGYLQSHDNPLFDPPRTTDNIGVIRTNRDGTVIIEFDFRLIPDTDISRLLGILQTLPQEFAGAHIEVIRINPPMNTPKDSEMAVRVEAAQTAVGLPKEFLVKSGNTEGSILNDMGAQSVITGPGRAVGNIHAPNEHNQISQLQKAVDFYEAFLRQFC